jgi:hypothetical protein
VRENDDAPLNAALDRLEEEEGRPTVGEMLEDLGGASFGYTLFLPAIVVVTPLSGIPGLSSLCGITIALAAVQMLAGRKHVWLPRFIRCRRIDHDKLDTVLRWMRRPLTWVDRVTRPRLEWLVHRPAVMVLQLASLLCGAAMPVLELVPLTSSILGLAVVFFSVSMVTRDGLLALGGMAVIAGAVAVVLGVVGG